MRAHQRLLREPQTAAASLDGYRVEEITRAAAEPLIERYEWLGNIGRARIFVGLFSPSRELHGVVCFGPGPAGTIRDRIGDPALCLERGACVPGSPANAASFLISRAVKLVSQITGVDRFFAYADPEAGEYGGVYQAANWLYLGQGLNGKAGQRRRRQCVLPPGSDPSHPARWRTDRDLRRGGRRLTLAQARRKGWVVAVRAAKHVYAVCIGREAKRWRQTIRSLSYPAPHPRLKRARSTASPVRAGGRLIAKMVSDWLG
jgi:hypothetical protein